MLNTELLLKGFHFLHFSTPKAEQLDLLGKLGVLMLPRRKRLESHNRRIGIPAGCWNVPSIVKS